MVQDYRLYLISRHTTEPPSRARAQVVDGSRRDLNGGSVGIVASHIKYNIQMFSRDNSKFQPNSRSFVTHSMASVINLLTHSRKTHPAVNCQAAQQRWHCKNHCNRRRFADGQACSPGNRCL